MISSHYSNDNPDLYRFSRQSGLPANYFKRAPIVTRDGVVVVACVVAFIFVAALL